MKIIGVANDSEYIVQMSSVELGMLANESFGGWQTAAGRVGKRYAVSEAWHVLRKLKEERESLQRTANKLRALADILGPIECEIPTADKTETQ